MNDRVSTAPAQRPIRAELESYVLGDRRDPTVGEGTELGVSDHDSSHGVHETKQGPRFTISEPARCEVLQRLLKLNHERYAEEVKQGLHSKEGAAKKAASKPAKQEATLFDLAEDEE